MTGDPADPSSEPWPTFRQPVTVLRMLVGGLLFSILLAIAGLGEPAPFLVRLGWIALFVEWHVLILILFVGVAGGRLARLAEWQALGVVFVFMLALMTVSNAAVLGWSAPPGAWLDAGRGRLAPLLRNVGLGALFVFALLHYLSLVSRWQAQVRAEQSARLSELQARIRPHFLFNALNTIASLIPTRPDDAEQAVLDLSELLRSGLRPETRHALGEELALVRGYLRIESQRLGERLAIDWTVDEDLPLDQPIPALILQPLVENAVVHGPASRPDGGTVSLRARRKRRHLEIRIENPQAVAGRASPGNRMALDNIRKRLELAYAGGAQLESRTAGETFTAVLRLPIEPVA